jgi:hypothetical protein
MNDEVLKQTLQAIHRNLFEKISVRNNTITIQDIVHFKHVPNQIKTFLLAEIEFSARSFLRHIRSPRFDLGHASLQTSRNRFARELSLTAKLNRDEFSKYLEEAILLNYRYLYQPQAVLSELIFGSKTEQDAEEIHDRLKNFADYKYLTDVFLQYLEKKQIKSITIEKFKKIIADIDRKIIQTYRKDDLVHLLGHLYSFIELGEENELPVDLLLNFFSEKQLIEVEQNLVKLRDEDVERLSLGDMSLILEGHTDKVIEQARANEPLSYNLPTLDIPDEIEPESEEPEETPITLEDVSLDEPEIETVESATEPESEAKPQSEPESETASEPILEVVEPIAEEPIFEDLQTDGLPEANLSLDIDDDALAAEINAALAEYKPEPKSTKNNPQSQPDSENLTTQEQDIFLDDTNVPYEESLPENFENDLSFLEKAPINPAEPPSKESQLPKLPDSTPEPKPTPVTDIFETNSKASGVPKAAEDQKLPDLRALFSDSDRKRFIKKLFKGKAENFDQAISEINAKKSWREASVYIDDEIFTRYKIDEYTQEAVYFTDLVFERYQGRA